MGTTLKDNAENRFRFDAQDIAEIFGVTYGTIEKWRLKKLRKRKGDDQRKTYYDIREVMQARKEKMEPGKTKALFEEQAELARTRREKLELDIAIQKEQLIEKRDVERQAFETARRVRDYLLNIPNRIAGEVTSALGLQASDGQEKVYQILNQEIHQACEQFDGHASTL